MLCELLPVGIPSLAVCLQSLLHGTVSCSSRVAGVPDAADCISLGPDSGLSHQQRGAQPPPPTLLPPESP